MLRNSLQGAANKHWCLGYTGSSSYFIRVLLCNSRIRFQNRRQLATVQPESEALESSIETNNGSTNNETSRWTRSVQASNQPQHTHLQKHGVLSDPEARHGEHPHHHSDGKHGSDGNGCSHSGANSTRYDLERSIREFLDSTRQRARAGLKPDELVVKCPMCSPGKPRRLAYSAHLNTSTGAFVCTNCFEQGPWEKYQELAKRRIFQNTIPKCQTTEPPPFEFARATLHQLRTNLIGHEEIYTALTGHDKGQLKLNPEVLAQYGVGLGFVNTEAPEIDDMQALVEGSDYSVPCLVFPRTAFRTNSFIEGNVDTESSVVSPSQLQSGPMRGGRKAKNKALSSMLKDTQEEDFQINNGTGFNSFSTVSTDSSGSIYRTVQLKVVGWNTADLEMYVPVDEAQPGLFGFHLAGSDTTDIILAGHELDAVAAFQETGIPAMSLPRGPYQLPLDTMRALERFERVYVWLDDDHQGAEAAKLITRKLGVDRCLIVHSKGGNPQGPKSASIALARGYDLKSVLESSQPVQHDKVLDFSALREAVKFEVTNPDLIRGVESTDFPGWNAIYKGLRPGELTILSGPTGCGKTTVISQMSLDFCKSGVSTLWGSFEIPNVRLATRMMGQLAKKDLSKSPMEVDYWSRKFEQLPIYFLKFHGSTKPDTVLETMRHAVYAYDVKHIVIDNLQFMMSMQAKGIDKYDAQDAAIATFRQFATDENVHITVVAHLRKDQPAADADINSVFGSAKVTQEADNVVILKRHGNSESKVRCLNVLKNRFDGALGKVYMSFEKEAMAFKEIPPPRKRQTAKIVKTAGKLSIADRLLAEMESTNMLDHDSEDSSGSSTT